MSNFAQIPHAVMELGAHPYIVYGALRRRADKDGRCWPSHRDLATLTGLSPNTVKRALQVLKAAGWVDWYARVKERGDQDSNLYRVALRKPTVPAKGESPEAPPPSPDVTHPPATTDPTLVTTGLPGGSPQGHPLGTTGLRTITIELEPDELERSHKAEIALNGHGKRGQPAADFAAFWAAYPLKVGKRKAEPAFTRAAKRADPAAIIAAAIAYRNDPNREQAYTAHPTTWLNRDGWDDDPIPPRANGHTRPDPIQQGLALAAHYQAQGE
jgi:hypothetical protein